MPIYDDGTLREWVCVIHQVDQRPFGDETNVLLRRLMPDLLRASRLRVRMADLAEQAALGMAALDVLPEAAVALVDAQGLLRYANPAAQRVLAGGRGWRLGHGRVCANSPGVQEQLAHGIAAACRLCTLRTLWRASIGSGSMPCSSGAAARHRGTCRSLPPRWG